MSTFDSVSAAEAAMRHADDREVVTAAGLWIMEEASSRAQAVLREANRQHTEATETYRAAAAAITQTMELKTKAIMAEAVARVELALIERMAS